MAGPAQAVCLPCKRALLSARGGATALSFPPSALQNPLHIPTPPQALFLLLSIVFWLLAGGVANSHSHKAAGWIGLVVAGIAFYGGVAEMLNEIYDKVGGLN